MGSRRSGRVAIPAPQQARRANAQIPSALTVKQEPGGRKGLKKLARLSDRCSLRHVQLPRLRAPSLHERPRSALCGRFSGERHSCLCSPPPLFLAHHCLLFSSETRHWEV